MRNNAELLSWYVCVCVVYACAFSFIFFFSLLFVSLAECSTDESAGKKRKKERFSQTMANSCIATHTHVHMSELIKTHVVDLSSTLYFLLCHLLLLLHFLFSWHTWDVQCIRKIIIRLSRTICVSDVNQWILCIVAKGRCA